METQQQGGWEPCISLHCFHKTCRLQKVLLHSILRKMDCCLKMIYAYYGLMVIVYLPYGTTLFKPQTGLPTTHSVKQKNKTKTQNKSESETIFSFLF